MSWEIVEIENNYFCFHVVSCIQYIRERDIYLSECMRIFCSAKTNKSRCKQLSGPRLMSNCWKPAKLLGIGESSGCVKMIRSFDEFDNWIKMLGDGNGTSSINCVIYRSIGTANAVSLFDIFYEKKKKNPIKINEKKKKIRIQVESS